MHALDVHYGDDLGLSNGNLHQQFVYLVPLRHSDCCMVRNFKIIAF